MTAKYRIAEPFELRPPGTVQKKKGKDLRYSSLDHIRRCFAVSMTAVSSYSQVGQADLPLGWERSYVE